MSDVSNSVSNAKKVIQNPKNNENQHGLQKL